MIYIQNLNSFISLHNIYTTIKKEKKVKTCEINRKTL